MVEVVDLSDRRRPHRTWLAACAWTVVAFVIALILRVEDGLPLMRAVLSTTVWYFTLGALVWVACWLDVRFDLSRRTLARALVVHVAIGLAALAVWMAVVVAFSRLSVGPDYWQVVFGDWWMFQLLTSAMLYAAGVGIGLTVQSADREREREQREAHLKMLAREAELTAIKAQLQPHFLLNSLNSILVLIDHDQTEARRMLMRLASLLHSVFDRLDEPLVPLERELETIRDYLEIERIRFGDRMTFSIEAEGTAGRVPVPPLLLQPIVENAVKHGIESQARPGTVRVSGRLTGRRLHLSVADTGLGDNSPDRSTTGRGLALTRRRLAAVYGSDGATMRTERNADGFTVTLELPVTPDAA
jgi:two-component system LytT family sensor kinase